MTNDNDLPNIGCWIASSLVQKAVRRGDVAQAQKAVAALHPERGEGVWSRLARIASEDVGLGDLAVVEWVTRLAVDRAYRYSRGGEREMMLEAVAAMAAAPKDRSADHLLSLAQDGHELESFRDWCAGQSIDVLAATIADVHAPLERRATAMWCAVATGPSRTFTTGESLLTVLNALQAAGLPSELADAVLSGVRLTREPVMLMLPILASIMLRPGFRTSIEEVTLPPTRLACGIPCYSADHNTSVGKSAIKRWLSVNQPLADIVGEFVLKFRAVDVVGFALVHVEGAAVRRRLEWSRARSLQAMGMQIDLEKSGCRADGTGPILDAVRENLPSLDDIRCPMLATKLCIAPLPRHRGGEA